MRIIVRCPDARVARDTQARLAAAEIEALALPGPPRDAPLGQDIIIVPAPDGDAAPLSDYAHAEGALVSVVGLPSARPPELGLRGLKGFSAAIAMDGPTPVLAAQIEALTRVAVIEEERVRRMLTAHALGSAQPSAPEPRKLKALYIGAPSPAFLTLERAFSEHGGLVAAAFSSFAGFDHLHDEYFDAVVLNGAQQSATALSLCAALRRNASLYHLPTMVITAAGDHATAQAAYHRGAAAVAADNAPSRAALGWLFEAIRRERRRRAAEHDLRALRDLMGDVRTGLFRREAFDLHLARLAAEHHLTGRPLGLSVLRMLQAPGAREADPQVWKRGFSEIASLAARLMREADCGAAIGDDVIAIALPAAGLKAARRTAERIASVAECTAFAAGDNGAGPLVFEQSAVELQPGESGPGMLARALYALDVQAIPA